MNQQNDHMTNHIKAWLDNEVTAEKLESLKSEVGSASVESLDEIISPMWQAYDDRMIEERSHNLLTRSRQREQLTKLKARFRYWQIAAILIPAIITTGFMVAILMMKADTHTNYFELYAQKGEKTFLSLPDQSKVWLNSESCLKYGSDFSVNERRLVLDGEGFFDVAHHDGVPFIVSIDQIKIIVKGTKFNVKNDREKVEVALLEGKVDVFNQDRLIASLKPNQVIDINLRNPDQYTIHKENVDYYSVWTQDKLVIENENLVDISKKIEKWYGVNIQLFNVDPGLKYTFTIKTESLHETLNLLNQLMYIDYSVNGEEVMIRQSRN